MVEGKRSRIKSWVHESVITWAMYIYSWRSRRRKVVSFEDPSRVVESVRERSNLDAVGTI